MINKDILKQNLEIHQVINYVNDLGGEVKFYNNDMFIARTICHNPKCQGSHKLYYYNETKLFHCYTDCGDSFDIFDLTIRANKDSNFTLYDALVFVSNYFGYEEIPNNWNQEKQEFKDAQILERYKNIKETLAEKKVIELAIYNEQTLAYLPTPRILPWEREGISEEIMKDHHIKYNPVNQSIVIPHYDINNNLIGIRERTLVKEDEIYGKYRPAIINGKMYNHPLSFALYNLNHSKDNIKQMKMAIVGEGEKFCLKYASWFGKENDISVACCGSSLINHQVELLRNLGVREIVIAFDRQFQESGDAEFLRWTKKLTDIYNKYSVYARISFMFDKWNLLGYKESPVDRDKETFLTLFQRRFTL